MQLELAATGETGFVRLILSIFLVGFSLVAFTCSGERERKEIVELRRISDQTPLYPGFQKINEKTVLKPSIVYFFTVYNSNASFSDIKEFYDRVLPGQGWAASQQLTPSIIVGEKNFVSYRRGDYVIDVEGDQRPNTFSIVYIWNPE